MEKLFICALLFSQILGCFSQGTIYVMGGRKSGNFLNSVESYSKETGWSYVQPMPTPRHNLVVAVLDNLLYAIGGGNSYQWTVNTVEMYNPRSITSLRYRQRYGITLYEAFGLYQVLEGLPRSGQWTSMASMETKRWRPGAAAMGGLVFVVGGDGENSNALDTVESYNVTSRQWKRETSMAQPRFAPGVVELGGKLYAIGGYNRDDDDDDLDAIGGYNSHDGALNTVEVMDVNKTWSFAPSMNSRRYGLGSATLDGKIYVTGGSDGLTVLRSVEMFDPSENVWRNVASMKVARFKSTLVNGGDGKLYVLGGEGEHEDGRDLSSVEVYNPETDMWTDVANMESCAGAVGAGVLYKELDAQQNKEQDAQQNKERDAQQNKERDAQQNKELDAQQNKELDAQQNKEKDDPQNEERDAQDEDQDVQEKDWDAIVEEQGAKYVKVVKQDPKEDDKQGPEDDDEQDPEDDDEQDPEEDDKQEPKEDHKQDPEDDDEQDPEEDDKQDPRRTISKILRMMMSKIPKRTISKIPSRLMW